MAGSKLLVILAFADNGLLAMQPRDEPGQAAASFSIEPLSQELPAKSVCNFLIRGNFAVARVLEERLRCIDMDIHEVFNFPVRSDTHHGPREKHVSRMADMISMLLSIALPPIKVRGASSLDLHLKHGNLSCHHTMAYQERLSQMASTAGLQHCLLRQADTRLNRIPVSHYITLCLALLSNLGQYCAVLEGGNETILKLLHSLGHMFWELTSADPAD